MILVCTYMDITCILFSSVGGIPVVMVHFYAPFERQEENAIFGICTSVFQKTCCVVCSVYLMIHLFYRTLSKLSTESCSNREKFQIDFHIKSLRLLSFSHFSLHLSSSDPIGTHVAYIITKLINSFYFQCTSLFIRSKVKCCLL